MKNYIIVKKNNKYHLIDTCKSSNEKDCFIFLGVNKDNKVYKNIISKAGVEKEYLGKIVFESDDIAEIAHEFCRHDRPQYEWKK